MFKRLDPLLGRSAIMVTRIAGEQHFVAILHALLDDISLANGIENTVMDKRTIIDRFNKEGVSFLTKTLPLIADSLDTALQTGTFICPTNFGRYKNTALPKFLRGLLCKIFAFNGQLRKDADIPAITEVRQLSKIFYKTKIDFTPEQLVVAEQKFKACDARLAEYDITADKISEKTTSCLRLAREFIRDLFTGFDPYDITPCHGPGIVASGEKPHEKRIFSTKYKGIHNVYPYYRWFYINFDHLLCSCIHYRNRRTEEVGINKVLFVPKDSRGPRTIACEPLEYQFMQQGLRKAIYSWVEQHLLTKGRISFTDQTINQKMARFASTFPDVVTLDLKDASDSVSNQLVQYLFQDTPLDKPLQALRTPFSRLPNGEVVPLNKYAAMGSALCFPVEAIVFYALLHGVNSFLENEKPLSYVYGDDIICRKSAYKDVVHVFEQVGLQINLKKSCTEGFFRESCGHDYYRGILINWAKIRTVDTSTPDGIASTIEASNEFFERCYYKVAKYLEGMVPLSIPLGPCDAEYLCYTNGRFDLPPTKGGRWNVEFQYREKRYPVITGISYSVSADKKIEEYGEYFRKMTQGWSPFFTSGSYARRKVKISYKYCRTNSTERFRKPATG